MVIMYNGDIMSNLKKKTKSTCFYKCILKNMEELKSIEMWFSKISGYVSLA